MEEHFFGTVTLGQPRVIDFWGLYQGAVLFSLLEGLEDHHAAEDGIEAGSSRVRSCRPEKVDGKAEKP
eukprot:scaffold87281_cov36-Prasinocladus_malaysianus.AAC.2